MRNVSYKRVITNASAAADEITSRTKKKNRIYTLTFILLGILVLSYILYAFSLTTYDGFMVSRNVSIRSANNIVIVEYRVQPGDYVMEGDTLYSFVNIDWINKSADPYYQANSIIRINEATMRRDRLLSEYAMQKKTLDSLQSVVERAKEDIYMGVATKEYAEQLEWDKFMAKQELDNTARLISIEQRAVESAGSAAADASIAVQSSHEVTSYSHTERVSGESGFGSGFVSSFDYCVAYVDMLIVDVHARHGVLNISGEPIVTYMPYANPEMLDMHVKMLLSPNQFSNVKDGMIFNVYAGRDYIGKINTTYQSTFISDHSVATQDIY
ncbi:MAG: hypothetical protein SNG20_00655 [Rikenellaceae bacterium]